METKISKCEIAKRQLQTAVFLLLHEMDRSSAITLAGASGAILDQLLRNKGKEPFVDYACRVHRELCGITPKRKSYAHHIDKKLGVTVHKHMGKDDPEDVELDLEKMAVDAVARAVVDYTTLCGKNEPFVLEFDCWLRKNTSNADELIDAYKNAPEKLRPR